MLKESLTAVAKGIISVELGYPLTTGLISTEQGSNSSF
jgi:hypothetical protein